MFGYVCASLDELTPEQKDRYARVYCGICRDIRMRNSQTAGLALRYDMAFLALLLMSLYEPEEESGKNACVLHPIRRSPWVDSPCVRYAADMNVALAYYNAMDDWEDDRRLSAKAFASVLEKNCPRLREEYPRQTEAIENCITRLRALERERCDNPDEPAGCFGELMGQLLVWKDDLWAQTLYGCGYALGRFVYLADAAADYRADAKKGRYNPFLAMGTGEAREEWEQYMVLAMGRCTEYFERLPLVQDKALLDNILYSGVWVELRRKTHRKQEEKHDG